MSYQIIPPAINAIINKKIDMEASINWMADNGSSLILNWGDDNELWEAAWILDGKRYCGFSRSPREAVIQAVEKARDAIVKEMEKEK